MIAPVDRDQVSGIVLAGGRSRRFGSPKLAADLDGRTILEWAIGAVAEVASEVVVSLPPAGEASTAGAERRSSRTLFVDIHDPEPFRGPLVGLMAALRASTRPFAIVVGGDMPRLRPAVLRTLLAALEDADGVVLGQPGGARSLPVALRREAAGRVAERTLALGERSLRALLAGLEVVVVPEPEWRGLDPEADTLVDVDEPADLERLRHPPIGAPSSARRLVP